MLSIDRSALRRRAPLIAFVLLAGGALSVSGCTTVSPKEDRELAIWQSCIDGAIAESSGKGLSPQMVYFEVTYQCRASFPDWDRAGHSKRGRKLLTKLYSRLVM